MWRRGRGEGRAIESNNKKGREKGKREISGTTSREEPLFGEGWWRRPRGAQGNQVGKNFKEVGKREAL